MGWAVNKLTNLLTTAVPHPSNPVFSSGNNRPIEQVAYNKRRFAMLVVTVVWPYRYKF